MLTYNLTEEQKQLLTRVVEAMRFGDLDNDFSTSFTVGRAEITDVGEFPHSLRPNLIALEQADLITLEPLSYGNLRFSIKQSGFDAVNNNFSSLVLHAGQGVSIGAVFLGDVSGGNIQAIGFADHSEIQQIISDPGLLSTKIDEYLDNLIGEVRDELTRKQLLEYIAISEQYKDEMISGTPSQGNLQRLIQSLAFFGDVEGTISLVSRVWPYLYPLIILAGERLSQFG